MKRSIRFRIWNHLTKKFHPMEGIHVRVEEKPDTKAVGVLSTNDQKDCIQQSLNLHDIDGKEIFEGDIVDLYAKKITSYKPKALHQASVRWIESHACFGLYQYKDGQEIPIYKFDPRKLRVLGNVLASKPIKKEKNEIQPSS